MRTCIYVIAATALAGFANAGAQNTGSHATAPGTHAPAHQQSTLPSAAPPPPPPRLSPTPPMQPNSSLQQDMPTAGTRPIPQPEQTPPPTILEELPASAAQPMPPGTVNQQNMPSSNQPMQSTQPIPQGQPIPQRQPIPPAQPLPINPKSTEQQTVFPPDSRIDPNNPANNPNNAAASQQQQQRMEPNDRANDHWRVPPDSRDVDKSGWPDCSKMRGHERSECERREKSRDDLPPGVTTTQPESPPR